VNPLLIAEAGFQPLTDLVPVSKVSSSPLMLAVNPALGVRRCASSDYAEEEPGQGELRHLGQRLGAAPLGGAVQRARRREMVHVPYKGGAPAVQSVLAGDTQLAFATPPSVLPLVQAGAASARRPPAAAARRSCRRAGHGRRGTAGYEISFWYGFFVPAGTPADAVKKLFAATEQALEAPEMAKTLAREGTETSGSTSPEDFAQFLARTRSSGPAREGVRREGRVD
jgi:tripartite-type tricarboxylate transporter receptor subunit TctC